MPFDIFSTTGTKISEREPKVELPPFRESENFANHDNYVATEELKDAVNVALLLGQPLLLTGEPGTGKTRLADYIAWQLELDCHKFYTKSTSVSKDLFYRYDSLRHFHDAQIREKTEIETPDYIEYQALGLAIVHSATKRSIVLIDEIDKAPRDFPNDVLNELENMEFNIKETGEVFAAEKANRPIVIITSNSEKNLPDAFLRRCVFYHIPFPEKDALMKIVNSRVPLTADFRDRMLEAAIDHFLQVRTLGLRKKPATAELLSWIHVLNNLRLDINEPIEAQLPRLKQSFSILAKTQDDIVKIQNSFK